MYNKLFAKILDSSVWLEPTTTRICWITLLASMDEDGYAHFSAIENLANRARVTIAEATAAVECFLAPDKNSSNPANEGRRVERVPGGFMVLNAEEHRKTFKRILQREQVRTRVARHRDKKKNGGAESQPDVSTWKNGPKKSKSTEYIPASEELVPADRLRIMRDGLCGLFDRAPLDPWNYAEEQALTVVCARSACLDELAEIRNFQRKGDYFPQSIHGLLEGWTRTLDRARSNERAPKTAPEKTLLDKEIASLVKQVDNL